MQVLSIKINNILSISDTNIDFNSSGLVLVDGWNYDDNRANGAGKTAIFNALSFGLYGQLPRNITATEVLKKGCKSGSVEVEIKVGNDIFKVKRERPKREHFEKNGVKLEIAQAEFESFIKLNYDQFLVSMYSAQTAGNKFLSLNDSSKKDFILQLMNLNEFNGCKDLMKSKIKANEELLQKHLSERDVYFSKLEAYKESIVDDKDLQDSIDANILSLKEYEKDIIELQKVEKPDSSKYVAIEENLADEKSKILEAKADRTYYWKHYQELAALDVPFTSPKHDALCPYCDGELKLKGLTAVKIEDKVALKKQHEDYLLDLRHQMSTIKSKLDDLDIILAKDNELNNILSKLKLKKEKEYESYNKARNAISELNSAIDLKKSKNSSLQDKLNNNAILFSKVTKLEKKLKDVDAVVNDINKSLELDNVILSMFLPTGAPAYVLDSAVESFNEIVSDHMAVIWPSATYTLKSYKENSKGDTLAKFSEELIVSGSERNVGSLSGGEFRSLSLAVDFTIIDLLCKQFGIDINPIIMDEPFEGLDAVSRENVIELLEKLSANRQIIVIDHASEAKAMFSKVIKVEKRNGSSEVTVDI